MANAMEEWAKKMRMEFAGYINTLTWATSRAYADLSRRLEGYGKVKNRGVKERAQEKLKALLKEYFQNPSTDKNMFDEWHKNAIDALIKIYQSADKSEYLRTDGKYFDKNLFNVGIAQKWVNMSFKYLYSYVDIWGNDGDLKMKMNDFQFCHVPLDSYVICNAADLKNDNGFIFPQDRWNDGVKWSKLADYKQYLDMQQDLRDFAYNYKFARALDVEALLWAKPDDDSGRDLLLEDCRRMTNDVLDLHYRQKGERKSR